MNCEFLIKSGMRRGDKCGKITNSTFCSFHNELYNKMKRDKIEKNIINDTINHQQINDIDFYDKMIVDSFSTDIVLPPSKNVKLEY